MKRLFLITAVSAILLAPTVASAQSGTVVYRPELRSYVWVPAPHTSQTTAASQSPRNVTAKHRSMAGVMDKQDHHACCDKMAATTAAATDDSHGHHEMAK